MGAGPTERTPRRDSSPAASRAIRTGSGDNQVPADRRSNPVLLLPGEEVAEAGNNRETNEAPPSAGLCSTPARRSATKFIGQVLNFRPH